MNGNTKKSAEKEYERFIALALIPLFILLAYPFIFNTSFSAEVEEPIQTEIIKTTETTKENNTNVQAAVSTAAAVGAVTTRKNKTTTPTIANTNQPQNNNTFNLTYDKGDKIEYIIKPQNTGWKGVVENKQNGNYIVKITDVLLANDKQIYLATNNPCINGIENKALSKRATNQIITVPGRCIHQK